MFDFFIAVRIYNSSESPRSLKRMLMRCDLLFLVSIFLEGVYIQDIPDHSRDQWLTGGTGVAHWSPPQYLQTMRPLNVLAPSEPWHRVLAHKFSSIILLCSHFPVVLDAFADLFCIPKINTSLT